MIVRSPDHFARHGPTAQKCSLEIHVHRRIPDILVQLDHRNEITSVARGGVADQNIDMAELLDPLAHHCFNLRAIGNVCDDWEGSPAEYFDFRRQAI